MCASRTFPQVKTLQYRKKLLSVVFTFIRLNDYVYSSLIKAETNHKTLESTLQEINNFCEPQTVNTTLKTVQVVVV